MDTSAHILSLADRCVKCGLCLPQCPTYTLTENENESPRGRIALIQGWLNGQLAPSETLTQHLDQCLLCRRCERVCPSVVPFGEIMDESKALLMEQTKKRNTVQDVITTKSLNLLFNKTYSNSLFSIIRLFQKSGILLLSQKSGLLKLLGIQRFSSILPKLKKRFKPQNHYSTQNKLSRGTIALFTGCLSNQLDPDVVKASIRLLNRLGYDVNVPEQQTCCGALHTHDGNKNQAHEYANRNIQTFNQQNNITTIISLVNGCTTQLQDYNKLNTEQTFQSEVKDIIEFLSDINWPDEITFKAIDKTVALQLPCSLQNTLRAENKLITLMKKIPGITLPDNLVYNKCCGAAGSYFLRFPEQSGQLKNLALDKLIPALPDMIISSNLGCALQLKAGLKERSNDIPVIHPVVLLEQQIKHV